MSDDWQGCLVVFEKTVSNSLEYVLCILHTWRNTYWEIKHLDSVFQQMAFLPILWGIISSAKPKVVSKLVIDSEG